MLVSRQDDITVRSVQALLTHSILLGKNSFTHKTFQVEGVGQPIPNQSLKTLPMTPFL